MRSLARLIIPGVLALAGCDDGPQRPVQWTRFRSAAAGFEVSIPRGYTVFNGQTSHAFGEHPAYSVYWRKRALSLDRLGLKLLSAGYFRIPELLRYDASLVLDSFVRAEARMGGLENGRLIELNTDSFQGFPARRLRTMIDNGKSDSLYQCEQFILAGPRMYHLRTNGYKPSPDTGAMRYFTASFRMLP